MTAHQAINLLGTIHEDFERFPTISQFKTKAQQMGYYKDKTVYHKVIEMPWISKQATGTPASVEALFLMIKNNKAGGKGWEFGLRHTQLTEDQIWQCYEEWCNGKVHPMLRNYKEKNNFKITG